MSVAGMTFLGVWVPEHDKRELEAVASRNDRSQSSEVRRMLRAHLAAEGVRST